MDVIILVLLSIAATGFGAATVILNNSRKDLTKKLTDKKLVALSEEEAIEKASIKAKNIILEADQEVSKLREKNFEQIRTERKELEVEEDRLDSREKQIIERAKSIDDRFSKIEAQEKSLDQAKKDLRKVKDQLGTQLEKLSQLTREEAKQELMKETEEELKSLIARKIKEAEYTIQNTADEKAKEILVDAMQKSATDYVAETTATTIEIESE